MLKTVTVDALAKLILREHPQWDAGAVRARAERDVQTLDARFDQPLAEYAAGARRREEESGEFSLLQIQAMRGCGYLDAVELLDAYIRDPARGKALILRR